MRTPDFAVGVLAVVTMLLSTSTPVVSFLAPHTVAKKVGKRGDMNILVLAGVIDSASLPEPGNAPAEFSRDFITNNELFESIHESTEDVDRIIRSLELVQVPAGGTIIKEGRVGDSMYFLTSLGGKFICSRKKTEKILTTYESPGDYFGELAIVFTQPRKASITATEDSLLWKLSREVFLDSIDASDACKKLLKKKYQYASFADLATQFDPMDLFDLATTLSRPKRVKASFHSNLSAFAVFSYVMVLLSLWSPGNVDEFGFPVFVAADRLPSSLVQAQFSSALLCATSVLGMLRLPKRSPPARRIHFSQLTWIAIGFWAIGSSNLTGLQSDLVPLDAWGSSKLIIIFPYVMSLIRCLEKLNDGISGPKKGKETVPWENPRSAAIAKSTFLYFLIVVQSAFILPMLDTYQSFEEHAAPFLRSVEHGGLILNNCNIGEFWMGAGALMLTLTFEKKMVMTNANIYMPLLDVVMLYDSTRTAIAAALGY